MYPKLIYSLGDKSAICESPICWGNQKKSGRVFEGITERTLLASLKSLCKACKFEKPDEFELHSFRHYFASLCANHGVALRKALAWFGHSSSDMLDLYYRLLDDDSQQAMLAFAGRIGAHLNREAGAWNS